MRALLKLMVAVTAAVLVQWAVNRGPALSGGPWDDAQFIVRVGLARALSTDPGDRALVDAAQRLQRRQWARWARARVCPPEFFVMQRSAGSPHRATPPHSSRSDRPKPPAACGL